MMLNVLMMPQQFLIVASKETTNYYCMHTSMTQTLDGFKLTSASLTGFEAYLTLNCA